MDAGDLGGGGVLHEVVQRNAAVTAEPRGGVGEGGRDAAAHALGGDLPWDDGGEEVGRGDADVFAADVVLFNHNPVSILPTYTKK